jgi:hypothetical protein
MFTRMLFHVTSLLRVVDEGMHYGVPRRPRTNKDSASGSKHGLRVVLPKITRVIHVQLVTLRDGDMDHLGSDLEPGRSRTRQDPTCAGLRILQRWGHATLRSTTYHGPPWPYSTAQRYFMA